MWTAVECGTGCTQAAAALCSITVVESSLPAALLAHAADFIGRSPRSSVTALGSASGPAGTEVGERGRTPR